MSSDPKQMTRASKRRRAALIVVLIVIAVIAVYWWRSNNLSSQPTLPVTNVVYGQTPAAVPASNRSDSTRQPMQRPTTDANPDGLLEKFTAMLKEKKIEVCGLSDAEAALFLARGEGQGIASVNAALAEVTGSLIRSDKPRDTALGLYLQLNQVEWEAKQIEGSGYKPCLVGSDCRRNESTEASERMRAAATEPLVKLALAGSDPAIYAMAVYACGGGCASISYAGWAKIEPDNAAVWLMLAAEASTRKDIAARDAALQHASNAKVFDARIPSLAAVFDGDAVKRQSPLGQVSIGMAMIALNAVTTITSSGALGTICLGREPLDETRKGICNSLAAKMLVTEESMAGRMIATGVGKKLGWDEARLQVLRDEYAIAMGLSFDAGFSENMYSCESLTKSSRWIQKSLSKGERTIAREYVAESGKTLGELAEKYRKAYPGSVR